MQTGPAMTLVLTLQDEHNVIQFADRRLTAGSSVITEEHNKTALVMTTDTRLAMGFTGLAQTRLDAPFQEQMATRIAEAILQSGAPDYSWAPMVGRFAAAMSDMFSVDRDIRRLSAQDRRLTIHFAGFHGFRNATRVETMVSNYQSLDRRMSPRAIDQFVVSWRTTELPVGQPLGTFHHIARVDVDPLIRMMMDDKPPQAVVDKGVEMMRIWTGRLGDSGPIGDQIDTLILPADGTTWATAAYHSDHPTPRIPMNTEIRCEPGASYITKGGYFESVSGSAVTVPKVGRNVPCPCDSGRKYKRCHGAPIDVSNAMVMELQIRPKGEDDDTLPS